MKENNSLGVILFGVACFFMGTTFGGGVGIGGSLSGSTYGRCLVQLSAELVPVFMEAAELAADSETGAEPHAFLKEGFTQARTAAFLPMAEEDNEAIGEDRWDPAKAAALWQARAKVAEEISKL